MNRTKSKVTWRHMPGRRSACAGRLPVGVVLCLGFTVVNLFLTFYLARVMIKRTAHGTTAVAQVAEATEARKPSGLAAVDKKLQADKPAAVEALEAEPAAVEPAKPTPAPEEKAAAPVMSSWALVFAACKNSVVSVYGVLGGTGFIVSKDGFCISNAHVVGPDGGARQVRLTNQESLPFEVVVADTTHDVALLKIQTDRTFTPVNLGRSANLAVGDGIMTIGNPLNEGLVASAGVVGGLGFRGVATYGEYSDMILHDGKIHPGNSGGPLINTRGEVIAVNTASGYDIAFAMPIDKVMRLVHEQLAVEARYGIVVGMELDPNGDGTVTAVSTDSPAEAAGVREGDRLAGVNGIPLRRGIDLDLALIGRKGGDTVSLTLERGGATTDTKLVLGTVTPRPAEQITGLGDGVNYAYYEGQWDALPDFDKLQPADIGKASNFGLGPSAGKDFFAVRLTGYVMVPADGVYTFYTASDDGSRLYIGDQLVVDNNGVHGPVEKRGFILLAAGWHPVTVDYFELQGGESLSVLYEGPGITKQVVPTAALRCGR